MSSSLTSCPGCRRLLPSLLPPIVHPLSAALLGVLWPPTAAPRGLEAQNGGSNQGNRSLSPIWGAVPLPSHPTPAGNT